MEKKSPVEADIRTNFITPAIVETNNAKWHVMTQVWEAASFNKGCNIACGKAKKSGYTLLSNPSIPIAVFELQENRRIPVAK